MSLPVGERADQERVAAAPTAVSKCISSAFMILMIDYGSELDWSSSLS